MKTKYFNEWKLINLQYVDSSAPYLQDKLCEYRYPNQIFTMQQNYNMQIKFLHVDT